MSVCARVRLKYEAHIGTSLMQAFAQQKFIISDFSCSLWVINERSVASAQLGKYARDYNVSTITT